MPLLCRSHAKHDLIWLVRMIRDDFPIKNNTSCRHWVEKCAQSMAFQTLSRLECVSGAAQIRPLLQVVPAGSTVMQCTPSSHSSFLVVPCGSTGRGSMAAAQSCSGLICAACACTFQKHVADRAGAAKTEAPLQAADLWSLVRVHVSEPPSTYLFESFRT